MLERKQAQFSVSAYNHSEDELEYEKVAWSG